MVVCVVMFCSYSQHQSISGLKVGTDNPSVQFFVELASLDFEF